MDDKLYESMPSHDPNYKFMVWGWEENDSMCYCSTQEQCDIVAEALNFAATSFIESLNKEQEGS